MIPLFLLSLFIDGRTVYEASTFAIGLGLFGDPVLTRAYAWLDLKNYRLNKYRHLKLIYFSTVLMAM
jgi:hypothetical protein